jgi:hypothetical protein
VGFGVYAAWQDFVMKVFRFKFQPSRESGTQLSTLHVSLTLPNRACEGVREPYRPPVSWIVKLVLTPKGVRVETNSARLFYAFVRQTLLLSFA